MFSNCGRDSPLYWSSPVPPIFPHRQVPMNPRRALIPSLVSVLALVAVCASASAQQWQVFEEESVSLDYRNAADTESVFSVLCGAGHSDITIPLAPGIK